MIRKEELWDVIGFCYFKQKTAYEVLRSLVGSEMCIRDREERVRQGQDPRRPHAGGVPVRRAPGHGLEDPRRRTVVRVGRRQGAVPHAAVCGLRRPGEALSIIHI